jgi:outer membrane lipoprotein-sorting protein
MRRPALAALALAVPALVALGARAEVTPLDPIVAKLNNRMSGVKTTRGRFKQTKKLAAFDDTVESSGTFAIERPSKLRWQISKPFESILVITGDKGARWNEHKKSVEKFALADKPGIDVAVKQMFTWYSGDFEDVRSTFEPKAEQDGRSIALVPKNEKVREVMSKITIKFAADFATIESIAIEEKGGDRTDIAFEGVETNKDLDAKTFEIEK